MFLLLHKQYNFMRKIKRKYLENNSEDEYNEEK